jgi:hypothetical protein
VSEFEYDVDIAARGRGQGPDPAEVPIPWPFRRIGSPGVGQVRISTPNELSPSGDFTEPLLASQTAFDGSLGRAEGWGASALTGMTKANREAGILYRVMNTNNSGAGSFRQALTDAAAASSNVLKVIVFRVGGYCDLTSTLSVSGNNIIIAGHTAPGGGFVPRAGGNYNLHVMGGTASNFVFRHMVMRYFKDTDNDSWPQRNVVSFIGGEHQMWDHLSCHYGTDEVLSLTINSADNVYSRVTVQGTIIGPSPRPHSTGSLIRTSPSATTNRLNRLTAHHNLWAFCYHRNPVLERVDQIDVICNVAYNWANRVGQDVQDLDADYINNFWKNGPANGSSAHGNIRRTRNDLHPSSPISIYTSGNCHTALNGNTPPSNQKRLWAESNLSGGYIQMRDDWFRDSRRATQPGVLVTLTDAGIATFNAVMADVGANREILADGSFVERIDPGDAWIIDHAINGTGQSSESLWKTHDHFFGQPAVASGTPYADTDEDGIGDTWAAEHLPTGADAFDVDDNPSSSSYTWGYTFLECFLNGIVPGQGIPTGGE